MWSNFVQSIICWLLKLALLAALVVLGIVFVPDTFMDRVGRGIDVAVTYLQGQADDRGPQIAKDASQQYQETKSDAWNFFQLVKEKYYPEASSWVAGLFAPRGK